MLNVESTDEAFAVLNAEQLAVYYNYNDSNSLVNAAYTWVTMTNGNESVDLDTFFRPYEYTDGVEIESLSSYARSNLYAAAGGVVSSNGISNLDETGLHDYLADLTADLCAAFKEQLPNGSLEDFLGNKTIVPESGMGTPRFTEYYSTSFQDRADFLADSYVGIYAGGTMNYIAVPDLGTRTVYVEINGYGYGQVLLDDEVWISGSIGGTDSSGSYVVPLSIVIPMFAYDAGSGGYDAYFYESHKTYTGIFGSQYAFPIQFNDLGNKGASSAAAEELAECLSGAGSGDSTLLGLRQLGTDYFHLQGLFRRLSEGLYGKISHNIYGSGAFIQSDDPNALCDVQHGGANLYSNDTAAERISARGLISSALEHGIWEQNQTGQLAVSTVRGIAEHCRGAGTVFRVTSNSFASVETQLNGYTQDELDSFEAQLTNGTACLILPDSPVGVGQWTGVVYLAVSTNGGMTAAVDQTNGGTIDHPYWMLPYLVNAQNWADFLDKWNIETPKGADPVDMSSGSYLLEKTDLTLDGPMPLALKRSYSSASADSKTVLGYGWNHSFNMYVQEHTSPDSLMDRSLEDIAGAAAAYQAMLDILESDDTARSWAVANMIAEWAVDRLAGTAVTVCTDRKSGTFVKQPDGSFTPPAGMTVSLMETNGVYVLQERHGNTYTFNTNGLIDTVEDPHGNTLSFGYTGGTNLNSVQSSFGPEMTFSYTDGLLTSVSDNSVPSRTVEYQYDWADQELTNIVDAAGKEWSQGYDGSHQIVWVKDPEEITLVGNLYNSSGQVTNQISASGHRYKNRYAGNYSIEEDPLGNQTRYYFDSTGRTWSEEKPDGARTYTFFDGQGHVSGTVNELGVTNVFIYDTEHNLLVQTNAAGTSEQTVSAYGYDSGHHMRFITNALGTAEERVTEYAYTAEHAVDYVIDALGSDTEVTTDYTYTAAGLLQQLSEGNGKRITAYSDFDSYGNAQTITSTDAGTISRTFNARGDLRTRTVDGKTTAYGYDVRRLPAAVTNALGSADQTVSSKTYYDNGLLKTSTDAKTETTRFYWTPAYKPAGTVFPDGGSTTNLYDEADRLWVSMDAEDNFTFYTLDEAGRIVSADTENTSVTNVYNDAGLLTGTLEVPYSGDPEYWVQFGYDALNRMQYRTTDLGTASYGYDSLGRMTSRTDAASKTRETEFDELGRPEKSIRPSGASEETGYNALGYRTEFRNAEGKAVRFGVDAQGRVTAVTSAVDKVTSFEYDGSGNLKRRTAADLSITDYGYDAVNRLVSVTNGGVWEAAFDHDANGNTTLITNQASRITLGYDEMNRLSAVTQSVSSVSSMVQYQYDLNGNRTNLVCPGGLSVSYVYDGDNRPEILTVNYAGETRGFYLYYDYAGRCWGADYPNGMADTYDYGAEGLTTGVWAWDLSDGQDFIARSIERNELGFKETELIDAGIKPEPPETRRSIKTHNDADQLVSESVQTDVTSWTETAYAYSDNGCLTNVSQASLPATSYGFDYNNMLTSADEVEYIYDASGARIGRISGTATNYFVIDYTDGLKRPLAETDSSGTVTRYYIWAGMRLLAHIEANGDAYYYHQDERGSTLAITDDDGNITDEFAYMPYGYAAHTAHSNSVSTPFQWLGGYGVYCDSDTDLHLTLHRAYSCETKRFLQPDPLGIDGGVNVYAMANLNPLFFIDPYGLCAESADYPWYSGWYHTAVDFYADAILTHWERNDGQNFPPMTEQEAIERKWVKLPLSQSVYHMRGDELTSKYVSPDGLQEGVYYTDGSLVTDPVNVGTYNYASPIEDPVGHVIKDVLPYYLLGNSPQDAGAFQDRLQATMEAAILKKMGN